MTHYKIETMVIIGICGFQGAGKDTFANYLVTHYQFIRYSFADVLKNILHELFGWDRTLLEGDTQESRLFREQPDHWWSNSLSIPDLTPRKMMQIIGTDLFRNHFHDSIWIKIIQKKIQQQLQRNSTINIVVTDCRFPNEIQMIKQFPNSFFICVLKEIPSWFSQYEQGEDCDKETAHLHECEKAWIRVHKDFILYNDAPTKELFEQKINLFYNQYFLKIEK